MMTPVAQIQIEQSDVISFHDYGWPEDFEAHVKMLEQFHRPLICTEYMARNIGSTFDTILPIAKSITWGRSTGGWWRARARLDSVGLMAAAVCKRSAGDVAARCVLSRYGKAVRGSDESRRLSKS